MEYFSRAIGSKKTLFSKYLFFLSTITSTNRSKIEHSKKIYTYNIFSGISVDFITHSSRPTELQSSGFRVFFKDQIIPGFLKDFCFKNFKKKWFCNCGILKDFFTGSR